MSEQAFNKRRLREILVAASASEATDEQLEQLNKILADSADMREYASSVLLQVGHIRWGSQKIVASSLSCIGLSVNPERESTSADMHKRCSEGGRFGSADEQASPSRRASLFGWSQWQDSAGRRVSRGIAWALATACAIALVAWTSTGGDRGGAPVVNLGRVNVDQGTVRMRLPKVGFLVVDGPADFELVDPMRLQLSRGRISVDVTEESGHGFVVATPNGEVTDLGTRFGVDVTDGQDTGLVVFEGQVDLRVPGAARNSVERLIGGEAVSFGKGGQFNRIMSIATGRAATFQRSTDEQFQADLPLITQVSDTLLTKDTKRFYEIVYGGFGEDTLAYVDRPYEWNGIRAQLPDYLVGADYIKTFNDYKQRDFQMTVGLSRPANVYLLWDRRVPPTKWLTDSFVETDDAVGLDTGAMANSRSSRRIGKGAGKSIDYKYSVWLQTIDGPGFITLGSLGRGSDETAISMYGIAVVPLDAVLQEVAPLEAESADAARSVGI